MKESRKKLLIQKIYTISSSLTKKELEDIQKSAYLKTELEIASRLDASIKAMEHEKFTPPPGLRNLVMRKILEPAYKIWHVLVVMFIIVISPVFLTWESEEYDGLLEQHLLITIFIYYGILITLLLLPLSYQIISKHRKKMEHIKDNFDEYLDSSIGKARNIFHK